MMFFAPLPRTFMTERGEPRSSVHIPMVYEEAPATPTRWEYHVLTIDTREASLPDAARLNELGREGWILAGMIDERTTGRGALVYYYFMRQSVHTL